ncbi:lyase family protein [Mycolicibacterium vinylchloridicum]|uniref:lyase family protein n=1 Tax=Mycolicibacterium vinylchloridicum TaxID=2736928 RepID=UPI00022E36AE|nr:lyase family protein [Mycolicibacterium vinylchloridicum]EHB46408.1 Argininosuccinate lyase [Mycolicibacterium rhodesiae JS60]
MTARVPNGYLGAEAAIKSGPAAELVAAGYQLELSDAPILHRGLGLADLAHVLTLRENGIVPTDVAVRLLREVLDVLGVKPEDFPYDSVYGDAYNSREREFERRLGDDAGWLHTGRTRREAGRIAFRLALRNMILDLHKSVDDFVGAVTKQASQHAETIWPESTYLQPAQPSTFGHYLSSFGEQAMRQLQRLQIDYGWADRSPAGVGGVGGGWIPLDRHKLSRRLGFEAPGAHTRDIMWATDGLADVALTAVQSATTIDRLAEDFEIFTSPNFGYVSLDPSLCRASVLLPQKRNPYAIAVIRSGAGTLVGKATGLLVTQRTPSARTDNWLHAYGEVTSAMRLAIQVVQLGARVVDTLTVDVGRMAADARRNFTGATDMAEILVADHNVDYRRAYRVVGRAVTAAAERGDDQVSAKDLVDATSAVLGYPIEPDDTLLKLARDPTSAVYRRVVTGGSSPGRVHEFVAGLERRLAPATRWRTDQRQRIDKAEQLLIWEAESLVQGDNSGLPRSQQEDVE